MVRCSDLHDGRALTLRHTPNRSEWHSIRRAGPGSNTFGVLTFGPRLKARAHQRWEVFASGNPLSLTPCRVGHPRGG